ncbi:MAG TPA: hypothetical protein DCG28_03730 [Lachnospiraceae bacterium]|nr:hypothetical protein [Lachnospiraceae bacterium]
MKICPKCGLQLRDDTVFCSRCGTNLEATEKRFCPRCNAEIKSNDAVFCRSCGLKFDEENKPIVRISDNISKICCHCGASLTNENARFCKVCGGEFNDEHKPLPLSDNAKYYRICMHCGTPYEIRTGIKTCNKCGTKLDPRPRTSPQLSEEEQARVRERMEKERKFREQKEAAERKKCQAERLALEREEKIRQEKERILKEQRAATRRKVRKTIGVLVLITILCLTIGNGIWMYMDKTNIKNAEAALCENNYTQALELYGKIHSKSGYYNQAQKRIEEINTAVECCDKARKSIEKPSYLDAMQQCKNAKEYNTNMPMVDELYTNAQNGIAEYINKLIGEENYKNALVVINKVEDTDRNEAIKAAETTVMDKVKAYYSSGNELLDAGSLDTSLVNLNAARDIAPDYKDDTNLKTKLAEAYVNQATAQYNAGSLESALAMVKKANEADNTYTGAEDVRKKVAASYAQTAKAKFNEKNMTEALNYANKALDAYDNDSDAKNVKANVDTYNKYVELLNKAGGQYGRWEIANAHDTLSDVPTDTIGNMARANFPSLISNISNDYEYRNNPVTVSSMDASFTEQFYNSRYDDGSVWGYVENRINRPVTVKLKFYVDAYSENYLYATYTLGAKETRFVNMDFYDVYFGPYSRYSYNIYIDDYTVN